MASYGVGPKPNYRDLATQFTQNAQIAAGDLNAPNQLFTDTLAGFKRALQEQQEMEGLNTSDSFAAAGDDQWTIYFDEWTEDDLKPIFNLSTVDMTWDELKNINKDTLAADRELRTKIGKAFTGNAERSFIPGMKITLPNGSVWQFNIDEEGFPEWKDAS